MESFRPDVAKAIRAEKNWRANYWRYIVAIVEQSMVSPEACLAIADRGLKAIRTTLRHRTVDGKELVLSDATRECNTKLVGVSVCGEGAPAPFTCALDGVDLTLPQLEQKAAEWVSKGVAEPSVRESLSKLRESPDWLSPEKLSSSVFVVLGAGIQHVAQ